MDRSPFAQRVTEVVGRLSLRTASQRASAEGIEVTAETIRRWSIGQTKKPDPYKLAAFERAFHLRNGELAELADVDAVPEDEDLRPPGALDADEVIVIDPEDPDAVTKLKQRVLVVANGNTGDAVRILEEIIRILRKRQTFEPGELEVVSVRTDELLRRGEAATGAPAAKRPPRRRGARGAS